MGKVWLKIYVQFYFGGMTLNMDVIKLYYLVFYALILCHKEKSKNKMN